MTNLNKGRFKSADEAQAVWNFFALQYNDAPEIIEAFKKDKHPDVVGWFDECANNLHKARLIHGSIYDEHGRIEDKDVAYAVTLLTLQISRQYRDRSLSPRMGEVAVEMLKIGEIRGTIFY